MSGSAVLHVTSMPGGGVNRHIGDVSRAVPRPHVVWHVGGGGEVIERAASTPRYAVLAHGAHERQGEALADWLRRLGVGLVHVHSIQQAPRARAAWAARALGVPFVATLHDVLFMRRDGFEPGAPRDPDPQWLEDTAAFLAGAAARIAPSQYLAQLAMAHLQGQEVVVIPNGSPPREASVQRAARPEFLARRPARVAAVLGAIGPHKGARVLEEVAARLAGSDVAIAVIGYLDEQMDPGWRSPHLFVHGATQDEEHAALLHAYGAQIALFPNQVPESFSYALSDVWDAGLPALVPPEGALAERVLRHGGGWLLPAGFTAADIERELRRLLSAEGAGDLARVKSQLSRDDPPRVPRIPEMARSLEALYARFALDPAAGLDPHAAPAQSLLATSLDGALFRHELVRLADEHAQLKAGLEAERRQAARFESEAREWIAKLEHDVAALQGELRREFAAREGLAAEVERLRPGSDALRRLPAWLQRWLLRKSRDARR